MTRCRCGLLISILTSIDSRCNLNRLVIHKALALVDEIFPLRTALVNNLTAFLYIFSGLGLTSFNQLSRLICYLAGHERARTPYRPWPT